MKESTHKSPRQQLQDMLTEGRNHELVDYAKQIQNQLLTDWISGKRESLQRDLRYESALLAYMERFLQKLDETRYASLRLGALLGTVESFERILYEQNQNLWAEARFTKEPVKHLPEVVQALEIYGQMSHTALSEHLKMNPPTLTEAMKKILTTGAVQASTVGKYKMYSLSDAGLRYGKELRKRGKLDLSLIELCEKLNLLLQSAEDAEKQETIKSAIMEQLNAVPGMSINCGDVLQFRDQDYPQTILGKFRVDSLLNIMDSTGTENQEKILLGHLEEKLKSATNQKRDQYRLKSVNHSFSYKKLRLA